MIDLPYLDRYPNHNIEEGVKVLDKVYWFIKVNQYHDVWYVYAGEELIFKTDSKESLTAFLYGISLTYVSIDQKIVDYVHKELKKWVE